MIDTLPPIALAHLLPHQSRHHALHPLLTKNRILCRLKRLVVVEVDALEGRRDRGLFGKESCGLGGRHCGGIAQCAIIANVEFEVYGRGGAESEAGGFRSQWRV